MKDFNKIKYERVDYSTTKEEIDTLLYKLKETNNEEEYIQVITKINDISNHIEEMYDYADIRNMRELSNEYYTKEIEYWNQEKPKFDALFIPFYTEILNSRYKETLKAKIPNNFFKIIEYQLKTTSNKNIELLTLENELKTKYRTLNNTKIIFDNEEVTISKISKHFTDKDRTIRKKAHDVINDFYYEHKSEYTSILFELINVRNKIAKNLGFNSYTDYSLYKLKRFGYDYKDIKNFRDNIISFVVPLCKQLNEIQKKELSLDEIKYYDTVFFNDMPKLKDNLIDNFKESLKEIDDSLYNLFSSMLDNNYIDYESRTDKVNFSITNYLTETHMPVITCNFKNSYLDLITLSHELGHSFQKYNASIKDKEYIISPLLKYPTLEIAEMFSYSMELITMNHVSNLFLGSDYKKYCFMKIYNMLSSLLYICLVDEFQETIYNKEDLKQEEINEIWNNIATKYKQDSKNKGHINLESGGYYYRQSHIFLDPFYYIDYALSYFGAFAIWNNSKDNLNVFKEIASVASYYGFNDLIDKYNMPSPFDEDTVKQTIDNLWKELESKM